MPVLLLRRHVALTMPEITKLPPGCVAVSGEGDVVARATSEAPLPDLLGLAVRMGRAVPDAKFEVEDASSYRRQHPKEGEGAGPPPPPSLPALGAGPPPPPAAPAYVPKAKAAAGPDDAWGLLNEGRMDEAENAFSGRPLDPEGRDRVRDMLRSTDPQKVAVACRIARLTGWKSVVQNIRRLVGHADTRVRIEAVQAIAALAGPGFAPVVRPLLSDPSPEVREAAQQAMAVLEPK